MTETGQLAFSVRFQFFDGGANFSDRAISTATSDNLQTYIKSGGFYGCSDQ